MWYDRQGNVITIEQADALMKDKSYKHVKRTQVGAFRVSTVWTGFDINWRTGNKQIFETMVFPLNTWDDLYVAQHETEEEALIGHTKAVYLAALGKIRG
jgi:hypothetical protein